MESNQAPLTRSNDPLGLNKISKNIKKSPLHQPNFPPSQPQPQVYNVNKNDFRNIVQQLTGSPLRETLPRPPQNNPKPPNNRLQRVRPPPLAHTNRPRVPLYPQVPVPSQPRPLNSVPYSNSMIRPHFDQQLLPNLVFPPTPNDVYVNSNESPVSAYMRYLQNSVMDSSSQQGQPRSRPQVQAQPYYPVQNLTQPPQPQHQLVPNHVSQQISGPIVNAPAHMPPSPRFSGPTPIINLVSPRPNIPPPLLQSPNSQFLLPSPSGFFGVLSPRSPYPLLSPGYQNLPPISPSFIFSPIGQPGILGPSPNLPPSPGFGFPLSPSGFFPLSSPRWRS